MLTLGQNGNPRKLPFAKCQNSLSFAKCVTHCCKRKVEDSMSSRFKEMNKVIRE